MNSAKTPSNSEPVTRIMVDQKLSCIGGQKYLSRTTSLPDTYERAIVKTCDVVARHAKCALFVQGSETVRGNNPSIPLFLWRLGGCVVLVATESNRSSGVSFDSGE